MTDIPEYKSGLPESPADPVELVEPAPIDLPFPPDVPLKVYLQGSAASAGSDYLAVGYCSGNSQLSPSAPDPMSPASPGDNPGGDNFAVQRDPSGDNPDWEIRHLCQLLATSEASRIYKDAEIAALIGTIDAGDQEIVRLLEILALVPHDENCATRNRPARCRYCSIGLNEPVLGRCTNGFHHQWEMIPPEKCDCIKSKVLR